MYAFDFERPATVAAAVDALADEEALALSGGQTLIPTLKQRLASPSKLVSLTGIAELVGVSEAGGVITIGGATTHAEIAAATAASFPAIAALAGGIGDPAVRNRGTVGGSLANNDPAACWPAGALGAGAIIVTNTRDIAVDDFFQGMFTTALDEGEIITAVKIPLAEQAAYVKFVQPASRFALTAVFVAKFADGVRVAVTGASEDGVYRWTKAEEALAEDFSAEAIAGLEESAEGMIGDLHGAPEYRAHLVGVMTRRAVAAAG